MPHCPIIKRLVLNMLIMPQDTLVRTSRNFSVNPDFSKSAGFFSFANATQCHNQSGENKGSVYDLFPSSLLCKNADFSVLCSSKHVNIITDGCAWFFTQDIDYLGLNLAAFLRKRRFYSISVGRHIGPLD